MRSTLVLVAGGVTFAGPAAASFAGSVTEPGAAFGTGVPANPSTSKELPVAWEAQTTFYYCGPTATRMALKAKLADPPSQDQLAGMLGTDEDGTDDISLVRGVLNDLENTSYYEAKYVDGTPTQAQVDLFRYDVAYDVDRGYALVANIWIYDGGPRPQGYPGGTIMHYVTVIGYDQANDTVLVADPAAQGGGFGQVPEKYWIDTSLMTTLIGGKGYAA